jgi:hypothetical protein
MPATNAPPAEDKSFVRLAWLYIRPKADSFQNEVLFVRSPSGDALFIPGVRQVEDSVYQREKDKEVLTQKMKHDLTVDLVRESMQLYVPIQAPAFGKKEGVMVKNLYYFAKYTGELRLTPRIHLIEWVSYNDNRGLPITPVDQALLLQLKDEGILT